MTKVIHPGNRYYVYFYGTMSFTYPKKEKLKSKKLIDRLFSEGKSVSSYPIKLIYLKTELPEGVKIQTGVTVSKRRIKSAVDRNRVKRLLRESYRLNKQLVFNNTKGTFAFLFLYLGREIPPYHTVEEHLVHVMKKFLNTIDNE